MATPEVATRLGEPSVGRPEERFVNAFELNEGHTLNGTNAAIVGLRREAIKRFAEVGLPTKRNEAWKYTDVVSPLKHDYRLVPEAASTAGLDVSPYLIPNLDAHVIVTVNGHYAPELSAIGDLPDGVIISGFAEAAGRHADLVNRYFNTAAGTDAEALTTLNTAFVQDGVFVYVPKSAELDKPLHIVSLLRSDDDILIQPRNLLVFEENSRATLLETSHILGDVRYFTNGVEEIFVAQSANVDYYKLQDEGDVSSQVNGTYIHQGRDSVFSVNTFTLSGALVRNNLTVTLDDEHIESHLLGLVLPTGSQHVDVHTLIDHAKPNCVSNELYKYVLDDKSTAVFNGKVFVRPDAQQTNAYQQNKSILLSPDTKMHAKPELEIYADDVKCSHGATTGQLDAEAMFYLRSRGLSERAARGILLQAFTQDVIESVRIDALRDWLDARITDRFTG